MIGPEKPSSWKKKSTKTVKNTTHMDGHHHIGFLEDMRDDDIN